ncbi:MAG: thiamine pyrophosphate-dependent enzyme [Candidatus Gastranaerophilales bacterium]|nr:thiamine pyrophosphate-dependent enzyme [Candidatus Gastranaerophilales bacterium]
MEQLVFEKPKSIRDDFKFSFCPGCDHGVVLKLVAEVLDELGVRENTIAVASVGCSVFLDDYLNLDIVEAPHGRATAVATGVKRSKPDKFVFTYQGDGDFASIGMGESVHTASRNEKVSSICINNTTYGMTGGQAGPTTLLGQVTTTTPKGRKVEISGYPVRVSEVISQAEGAAYVARVSVDNPKAINETKKAIKKAFEAQVKGLGFGFVEVLASCPTNWKMTPQEAHERVRGEMSEVFVPGVYKDISEGV